SRHRSGERETAFQSHWIELQVIISVMFPALRRTVSQLPQWICHELDGFVKLYLDARALR
ncbi:MAG TPA: hypothetical protein VGM44_06045, partial [Polyangiaceae bacterium]